ncbi:GAF domain-containing protein [Nocardioides sp. GY 10113]|uniref:GAF domain-containing protein n=1 Tax=Nocardioides sp. GY 10113 TaxID=2569761 RepID=UPI0010A768D0|nr:GAF domain-containing protein [Nocardioides sp. GY 10113]TIC80613.1 GAF domain-containing protein [Nocardioides sp. GY 10113]
MSGNPSPRLGGHAAVDPGTDLSVRARELRIVHDAVLSGVRPASQPRALVARSWRRVMEMGLDADAAGPRDPLPAAEVERRRAGSALHLVIDELRHVLTSVAEASAFLMVVTDADGVVLWREGSSRVRRQADVLGFAEGATWTESAVGTNAIGTALAESAPVELFSAEHYENAQHPWYCSAWPIHDPRTGRLIGVVDVSGPALTLHPAIRMLVESAVRLAEAKLLRLHADHLELLRRHAEPLLAGSSGPALVVDDLGWVAHRRGVGGHERTAAPVPGQPLAIPGIGLCLPERFADRGWLLRPGHSARLLHARLDLATGMLTVDADADGWRRQLTRRHAELLRLVAAAGPDGVTARTLSTALYGDADHEVTIRAELSRLRKAVGALVDTQPYRVAASVELTVSAAPPAG